jgi:hypothetical protein
MAEPFGEIRMSDVKEKLEHLIEELRQARDELHVQMHLAKAEVKDEWEELEDKWEQFRDRSSRVGHEAGGSAEDIGEALELLGEELKKSYRRIREAL